MKVIYSLKEYYEEVLKLAKSVGKDYGSVSVEINPYNIEFRTFITDHGSTRADTMEESIRLMKEHILPSPKPEIDVEIDIPYPMPPLPEELHDPEFAKDEYPIDEEKKTKVAIGSEVDGVPV